MLISSKKWTSLIVILSGFFFYGFAQTNQADLKILSENADVIITGKVTQQSSGWNENKTRIFTHATIQVEEILKGTGLNSVVVSYPGGEVGEIGELYTHTPKFDNNEEVLVFLKNDINSPNYKVLNGEDGKISVVSDIRTGEKITSQNIKLNSLKLQIKNYINN